MKWLRRIFRRSAAMPTPGWLNHVHPPEPPDPRIIPPYCTWCGTEWLYVGEDDHMVCARCDFIEEGTFA